jgi:MFS family permease
MHEQLGFSYDILNDSYAIGCGTLAIGAFLLIPFALKWGRRPVYIVSTALQFAICIWSAKLETVADILLINAFSCLLGALAEVIVQMTVADVFFVHQRGLMNTIYVWMSSIGGSLAPLAAGYITVSQGWRWVWWWMAIFFGVALIAFLFLYEETKYAKVDHVVINSFDVKNSTMDMFQEMKDEESKGMRSDLKDRTAADHHQGWQVAKVEINTTIPMKSYWQRLALWSTSPGPFLLFARHSWQPFVILFTFPAVFFMSLVYGTTLAASTVMITTLSSWMAEPPYNFNSAQIGLMSLPSWIGTTLGALICGPVSDWIILNFAERNNGTYEPEMRLWVIAAFIPFVPAGLYMFGIGLNNGASWPVLAVGYAICSFGTTPASSIALTYITDSFTNVWTLKLPSVYMLTVLIRLLLMHLLGLRSHAM